MRWDEEKRICTSILNEKYKTKNKERAWCCLNGNSESISWEIFTIIYGVKTHFLNFRNWFILLIDWNFYLFLLF